PCGTARSEYPRPMPTPDHPVFPHLFRPYALKGVPIRNRVVISAHLAGWWVGPDGLPSDAFADYIEERAKGGVGLSVIGAPPAARPRAASMGSSCTPTSRFSTPSS